MAQGLGENLDINIGVNVTGLPQIQQVQTRMKNLNNTIQKSTSQYNANVVATNKWAKGALQQAGYQVGDFAVQVANGTSKMQAFGQQGSQLLGIFGPVGAVLGAVVAIFSAFGVAAQKAGKGAKEANEKVVDLGTAFSALERIDSIKVEENLSRPAKEAAKEYQNLINLMHEAAKEQRDAALGEVIGGIQLSDEYKKIEARLARIGQNQNKLVKARKDEELVFDKQTKDAEGFFAVQEDLLRVQRIIAGAAGETREEAAQNLEKTISILEANQLMTPELRQQLEAYAKQAGLLTVVENAVENAAEKTRALYNDVLGSEEGLKSATDALNKMFEARLGKIDDTANKYVDILGSEAGLAAAVSANNQLYLARLGTIDAIANSYIDVLGSEGGLRSATSALNQMYADRLGTIDDTANKYVDVLGSEEGLKSATDALNKMFKDRLDTIAGVGAAGGSAMQNIKEGVEQLTPEMQRLKDLTQSIEGAFETGFMSIIDGTSSVADAFRSMASSIIKELYRVFVVKRITGFISDAIGFAALPAGGTYTGSFGLPSFPSGDGGGYTGNGARAGGLDGKGGFMAMLHPRETIVDHTKGQGGGVIVNQTINVSTGVQQTVRTEIKQLMPQIADAAKSAVVDAKLRGGSYGRAFA